MMKNKGFITVLLLVVSAVLVGVGLWSGDNASVLGKAVTVCLECIGIG